ncbi:hypothetical protein H8E77_34360 [bacterium]|nr:hypothetical protein [bacterium]
MQRIISTSLLIALLGLIILWAGCGGGKQTFMPQGSGGSGNMQEILDPFPVPENDPTRLFASTSSDSKSMQLSVDKAKHAAQLDIAQQMQLKVRGWFQSFMDETGGGEDPQLLQMVSSTSESIVSESLIGCKVNKKRTFQDKNTGMYRTYVLMEMPLDFVNAKMISQVRNKEHLYTRFEASRKFKEMEEKVGEYEKQQKEQMEGMMP